MWKQILNAVYPKKCIVCHRLLKKRDSVLLCNSCHRALRPLTEPRCKRCSKPLDDMEQELCSDCLGRTSCVERGFALYPYDKNMQKAVRNLKYNGELACGEYFAEELVETYGRWIQEIRPEVLIPVPIHRNRMRFRGFNQAEYIAGIVGSRLGIPVAGDYLIRTENTKPQKGLDVKSRVKNLQKGFAVKDTSRTYGTVLLVDDIYTTGATLEACGRALKNAGNDRICFLCLCIGRGD